MICHLQAAGTIELYFYGELDAAARADVQRHLTTCMECRRALEDMRVIRVALANRPDVSTPRGGDWTGFMSRLEGAMAHPDTAAAEAGLPARRIRRAVPGRYMVYAAIAALMALVTISVAYVFRVRQETREASMAHRETALPVPAAEPIAVPPTRTWSPDAAFASATEQHFERSKLVVFSLANKDARGAGADDWAYERQLASSLLSDTRLYRLAAEERGLKSVARVMGDLELVLLQTSLSSEQELRQIQRLIRKRDLVTRMDVVAASY
jgi:hypothetical protein